MTYAQTSPFIGAQPITAVNDAAAHLVGTRIKAYDPTYGEGEFIYLPGVANCIAGSTVVYDEAAGSTTLAVAASRGPAAVAMAATVATKYGWFQILGSAVVAAAGAVVAQAPAYVTATAGKVDDAVVAGQKIDGMVFKTADGTPAANFAVAQIHYPSANGNG